MNIISDTAYLDGYTVEDIDYHNDDKITISLKATGESIEVCPVCGWSMMGHGYKSVTVTDIPLFSKPVNLILKYHRKKCWKCGYLWAQSLSGLVPNHLITQRAYDSIIDEGLRLPFEQVRKKYLLSAGIIRRYFFEFFDANREKLRFRTPAFLGIYLLNSEKHGKSSIFIDLNNKTIYDIVKGNDRKTINDFFASIKNVESITWLLTDNPRLTENFIVKNPEIRVATDFYYWGEMITDQIDEICRLLYGDEKPGICSFKELLTITRKPFAELSDKEKQTIDKHDCDNLFPIFQAYKIKNMFYDLIVKNKSVRDAKKAFEEWTTSVPNEKIYDGFRKIINEIRTYYNVFFEYWNCPICNATESVIEYSKLPHKFSINDKKNSFEIIRAKTLFNQYNINELYEGKVFLGAPIPIDGII